MDRYKLIYDSSVEGLQSKINEISGNGYRAISVANYTATTHYGVIALMEYEGKPRISAEPTQSAVTALPS